eukprot:TRINITY_DN1188_c0_g1_i2.p1 TRINITY_DN1188_c0_g1~~TRINITY_DN1188_c0_g1_i2.p1  ORF type:complete len:398 (+),score=124.80 TRINITY_DN1188_c0_g1_i2:25-1218(+)
MQTTETANKIDIQLAYRTLEFLGNIKDEEYPESIRSKIRYVIVNLCAFQDRFAQPMLLPFELGSDLKERLETPRPIDTLLRFNCAMIVDSATTIAPEDGCVVDNKVYCIIGKPTWNKLVENGTIAARIEVPPIDSMAKWIKDLFELLETGKNLDSTRKDVARRLASCWYHIATQVDFGPEDEEVDDMMDPTTILSQLTSALTLPRNGNKNILSALLGADIPDEDDDDQDYEPSQQADKQEDNNEDMDQEEEKQDDGENVEGDEGGDGYNMDLSLPDMTPEEKEARETIFRVVEELNAYMPTPDEEDLPWFKRVLKNIQISQRTGDDSWYPWGTPPMAPLVKCLQSDDPNLKSMAANIILLFQSSIAQFYDGADEEGIENEEDDEEYKGDDDDNNNDS